MPERMPEIIPSLSSAAPESASPKPTATLAGTERIRRVQTDADALDFDTLRRDAIALVQELCGREWSDYNLHDPGVTILEHLCFALTDLSYRCDFPVQDFLTGDRSGIDYDNLALYPPHEILPSAALTGTDYEKLLYDTIPEIDQIRFVTNTRAHHGSRNVVRDGLYTVYVKIDPNLVQVSGEMAADAQACATASAEIGRMLEQQLHRLDQLSLVTGQIGENLQIRQNTLIRWRERRLRTDRKQTDATQATEATLQFAQSAQSIILQADHCLRQLKRQTADLSSLQQEFQTMPDFLSARGCDTLRIARFFQQWADSEAFIHAERIHADYLRIASTLDAPLQKLDDLLPLLENALPALTAALDQTAALLDSGFAVLKADKQESSVFYETVVRCKILAVYCANRNLCEDIDRIRFIKTVPYFLTGAIEIDPFHNPAKVYAEIYFKCSRFLSGTIQIDHYATVMAGSKDYTRLFSGPLTQRGYIRDVALETEGQGVTVTELTSLIRQIDGVRQILDLSLVDADGVTYDSLNYQLSENRFPALQLSQVDTQLYTLQLTLPQAADDCDNTDSAGNADSSVQPSNVAGKDPANSVFADELMHELKKRVFEYHAFRGNTQSPQQFIELPAGCPRRFNDYYSMQNYFPAIYGVNRQGVPGSRPLDVHAKAKQLKAYLYPFEQLMANFAQDLQAIPELFGVHVQHNRSYFTQFLDDTRIPTVETLYRNRDGDGGLDLPSAVDDVLGQYDCAGERKNRILDIVLALYGERFDSQRLLQFNTYYPDNAEDWIIKIKSRYLRAMRETSRDRGKGFNYCAPFVNTPDNGNGTVNQSGLHARIGFLLGLVGNRTGRITDVLLKRNSRLISDRQLAKKIKFAAEDARSETVAALPGFTAANTWADGSANLPSQLPVFGYSIFKAGVRLANYRLVEKGRNETLICFKTQRGKKLWILSKETDAYKATIYAHQFCRTLTELNKASENFHILEHHLLRARQQGVAAHDVDDTFFHFRVSFIFPSWTARFADAAFRAFAEQTVQQQLPAHVHAGFYWLDFDALQDFEQRYASWLECLQQRRHDHPNDSLARLDQASAQLITFLIEHRTEGVRDYWL